MSHRYIKTHTGHNSWTAMGEGFSGSISADPDDYKSVDVKPSYHAHISQVGFGSNNQKSESFRLKDDDGNTSMPAIYLCALQLCTVWIDDKPVWVVNDDATLDGLPQDDDISRELLCAANAHPHRQRWSENLFRDWNELHEAATKWLLLTICTRGSRALKEAAALLEKIENKTRPLDDHETDVLVAIEGAVTETWDVPTQHDVWERWKDKEGDSVRHRQRKKFDTNLKRLGFAWLPSKKPQRGANAHFK